MIDLTKNETPLKDLPEEAQISIFKSFMRGEVECRPWFDEKWYAPTATLNVNDTYRIALPKRQEPQYPWEHLDDAIQYCAIDESGCAFGFSAEPSKGAIYWWTGGGRFSLAAFKFPCGNLHWAETLRKRPEANE